MMASTESHDRHEEGLAFLRLRDHLEAAEAAFRAGLAEEPGHAGCLLQLGITLRVQGRLKEAVAVLEQAHRAAPQDPEAHLQRSKALRLQRRPDEALKAVEAALALQPGHESSRVIRAIILQDLGRWSEALCAYNQLLAELAPGTLDAALVPRRREEVAGHLARIASRGIDPVQEPQAMALALYRQANRLILEGRLEEALERYEDVAALRPDYGDPGFPIGETVAAQLADRPAGEYLSCPWIESCLHFHEDRLAFCCTSHSLDKGWATVGEFHGGPVPVDFVLARRVKLTRENQAGEANACLGCPELERHAWPTQPRPFNILIINSHSACNQKCDYCFLAIGKFETPAYYYMAEPAIDQLIAHDWLAPDAYVLWGGGEPTVSREFPAISSKLFDRGCSFNMYTNVTRMPPVLLEALRQGRCDLVTSMDSGKPETFYRIKYQSDRPVMLQGKPAFEAVWANIAAYVAAAPDRVYVKYIFTPGNLGRADLAGFVAQCVENGVHRITLVPEFSDTFGGQVPSAIWDAICETKALAEANGLVVHFNPLYFDVGNMPKALHASMLGSGANHAWNPGAQTTGPERYLDLLRISVAGESNA